MAVRLAVFDCDGTLVDGQASICDAMEEAFAAAALPCPPRNAIRRIVGLSLPQAIRLLAPDAQDDSHAVAVEAYKASFRASRTQGRLQEPLFDGIAEALDGLRGAGWTLGVATGKSDRGLQSCLAGHGIADRFVTLQTADRHPSKPHPAMLEAAMVEAGAEPRDTVMIGDTVFDIAMAHAVGVRAIGVAWGYHSPEELLAEGADTVVQSPSQLRGMLA